MLNVAEKKCNDVDRDEHNAKMTGSTRHQFSTGAAGCGLVGRTGIRDRVRNAEYRAESEARQAGRMAELGALLDKNPDVARILDLIEEVGR